MRLDDDLKYFESQEFKDILARYEAAEKAGASIYMDADELTDVAEYYTMVENDVERANRAIDMALQLHPDAVDPLIFRARQYMLNGDVRAAQEACDAIPDQQHREVDFLRAELLVRKGQNKRARDYLLHRAEEVTEDQDYFLYDSAYIFIDYDDYESAKMLAEELEYIAPKWFKTWELYADVCLAQEDFKRALSYIGKMLDKDPFYLTAWNWQAEAYCGLYDYAKAFESTEYALAVEPDDERALELKAWVLMRQENYEQAHDLYTKLRQRNPQSEIHCLYDAYCLYDMERDKESLEAIELAEELSDGMSQEQAAIYEHHAHLLSDHGMVQEALHYIDLAEQAAHADGAREAGRQQDFDYYRARIYANNNDTDNFVRYLNKIGEKEVESPASVVFHGAQILYEAGSYANARLLLEKLRGLTDGDDPLLVQAYPYMASICHETGERQECLEYIRLALDNNSPEVKEILGYLFSEGVAPADYYDYYYYDIHGHWPAGH